MADRLLAEISLRFTRLLSIFTDGWRPYLSAILRAFVKLYLPKRKSRGRPLHKRLKLPEIFYGQVVKIRDEALKLVGVGVSSRKGKFCTPRKLTVKLTYLQLCVIDAQKNPYKEQVYQLMGQQRLKELLDYFEQEGVQKDPKVQTFIGILYNDGLIFEQSYSKAAIWWEKAALNGNAQAQSELAHLYFYGFGVKKSEEKGWLWLNKALSQDNEIALQILGQKYYLGEGVQQDDKKAFELFEKSAAKGKFSCSVPTWNDVSPRQSD
jgi:hypothetical protein